MITVVMLVLRLLPRCGVKGLLIREIRAILFLVLEERHRDYCS